MELHSVFCNGLRGEKNLKKSEYTHTHTYTYTYKLFHFAIQHKHNIVINYISIKINFKNTPLLYPLSVWFSIEQDFCFCFVFIFIRAVLDSQKNWQEGTKSCHAVLLWGLPPLLTFPTEWWASQVAQ